MSLVHFPETSSRCRCKCGRKENELLRSLCDVTILKYFDSVPFQMVETAYRLRKVDASDSTADPVEHEEVEIASKKIFQLLFLQMKLNMKMKMPTTSTMKQN